MESDYLGVESLLIWTTMGGSDDLSLRAATSSSSLIKKLSAVRRSSHNLIRPEQTPSPEDFFSVGTPISIKVLINQWLSMLVGAGITLTIFIDYFQTQCALIVKTNNNFSRPEISKGSVWFRPSHRSKANWFANFNQDFEKNLICKFFQNLQPLKDHSTNF